MADRLTKVLITFGGGWATDFGPSFTGAPQGNALVLPFLLRADNVHYELDGAPHKIGGSTVYGPRLDESGSAVSVQGLYDFWLQGTGGTETQNYLAYAGTQLLKSTNLGGTWDVLKTGLESGKEPCFETFTARAIWASTSTIDVPQRWDGAAATTSDLGGTAPNFSFHVKHKNLLWAAGVASTPSRLYFSDTLDPTTWSGGSAGSIDIDPDDGDRITAIVSHKNELIVFKGPNRMSVHRITGSSPSGSDAFARVPFVTGVGAINHNGVFRINDDVVFPSPRGLHSMAATAAFGDYVEAFLARPILSFYQDGLNHNVLNQCWGVNYQPKGIAVWSFAPSGSSAKSVYVIYDYRFQPGRWASWGMNSEYVNANCLAVMQTTARKHKLFAGTTGGYIHQLDVADRAVAGGTSYTGDWQTPFLNFGSSSIKKNLHAGFLSLLPKGAYNLTVEYTRDTHASQTATLAQGGGNVLG
jgi:hypothetical protein